jgi:hypothetical protein
MRAIFRHVLITLRNFLRIRAESFPRTNARLSGLGFCPAPKLYHPPGSRWLYHYPHAARSFNLLRGSNLRAGLLESK